MTGQSSGLFSDVVSLAGLLAAAFDILTALATVAYYRQRIISSFIDAITIGILPIGAEAFLIWIMVESIQGESAGQKWALIGILGVGILVMLAVRVIMCPQFFQLPTEEWGGRN